MNYILDKLLTPSGYSYSVVLSFTILHALQASKRQCLVEAIHCLMNGSRSKLYKLFTLYFQLFIMSGVEVKVSNVPPTSWHLFHNRQSVGH